MFGFNRYNYDSFSKNVLMKDFLLDSVGGPEPGARAPGFKARTLDGDEISLRDYQGERNVVLTFGSATCPFTAASIKGMNRLYEDFDGEEAQFLFCYVREAHPGERLPKHERYEDKLRAAELFRDEERVHMPVIVDDLKGTIHKQYGRLPNPTYLIDKSGRVAFRSLWTRPAVIAEALEELLQSQQERDVEHAVVCGGEDRSLPSKRAMLHAHRALRRGGRRAIQNFQREMGMPGRMAVTASRAVQPVTENPVRSAVIAGVTVGVIVGGLLLGRYLRARRFRTRLPYGMQKLGMPPRDAQTGLGDYEAVGI
jgi:peroxiredoxin